MAFQRYPSVRYFREADGRIGCWTVQSEAEDRALGAGYYDSPVKVPELAPMVVETPDPSATPPTGEPATTPSAPFPDPAKRGRKPKYALNTRPH